MTTDEVYAAMQNEGVFGILSGEDYACEKILPTYYQRQAAEQIFDFAKNYTKLLSLRVNTEATFHGYLLLSYVSTCMVRMIQLRLKEANLFFGLRLACLRNQKCTIYGNRIVTGVAPEEANDTYKAFGMKCPASIPHHKWSPFLYPPGCRKHPEEKEKTGKKRKACSAKDRQNGRMPKSHKRCGEEKHNRKWCRHCRQALTRQAQRIQE